MTLTELTSRRPAAGFSLKTEAGLLRDAEVLRFLPGRRLVIAATMEQRPVAAKIYGGSRRALTEYVREHEALSELHRRDIPAPPLLHAERHAEGAVVVVAWVPGQSARLLAEGLLAADAGLLALALVRFAALMHRAGCLQEDIHLDNFLVDDQGITLLDAASVRFTANTLPLRRRLDNLALLLAQFFPLHVPPLSEIIEAYGDRTVTPEALEKRLGLCRRRRYRHFLRKTTRNCTDFAPMGQGERVQGFCRRRHQELARLLMERGLDRLLEAGDRLKDGNSATVARVHCGGRDWVVKRYNLKDSQQYIKRQFGATRALNSWRVANWLRHIGIATPEPLMYLQEHRGLLRGRAWFVCAYVQGEELSSLSSQRLHDEGVLEKLADLLILMETLGFSHGDMKATNFLWCDGRLQVLDLDALRPTLSRRAHSVALERDWRRLLANWPDDLALHAALENLLRERGSRLVAAAAIHSTTV